MLEKALIIAAGNGSRLKGKGISLPKPLRRVAGLPLIQRIILTAKTAGIREFVIVVGYEKDKIIEELRKEDLGVRITFVENREWDKGNGLSVLAARDSLKENFVLLMSDHIFEWQTLASLIRKPLGPYKASLAIDFKIQDVFDIDDATKVRLSGEKIIQIGKTLPHYDAVDTGMFLASPELFDALEQSKKEGNCSLSDGIQLLSSRGEMGIFDIGAAFWQDVDTPPALRYAEKKLLESCRKPTDGVVSRNLNRRISLWITKQLLKTNLSANHMTGFTSLVGILSGAFVAQGDYWNVLLGATLFKLSSILDGCDGEMSKLKFTASKLGQWLDTISDNVTYACFIAGIFLGLVRQGMPHVGILGSLASFGFAMSFMLMCTYIIRHTDSGSLTAFQKDFYTAAKGGVMKFFKTVSFMAKRDFFALLFLFLAVLGRLDLILWTCVIGSNITWLVLLSSRIGLFKEPSPVIGESPGRAP